jgi:hypothetical protein
LRDKWNAGEIPDQPGRHALTFDDISVENTDGTMTKVERLTINYWVENVYSELEVEAEKAEGILNVLEGTFVVTGREYISGRVTVDDINNKAKRLPDYQPTASHRYGVTFQIKSMLPPVPNNAAKDGEAA